MDNILTLFTSEDKNEIRKAIKQIIIKQGRGRIRMEENKNI